MMANRGDDRDRQSMRLLASASDRDFDVQEITEFLYCPRAGLLAHEEQAKDNGLEHHSIRLGYLPRYERARIAELIGKLFFYLIGGSAFTLLLLVVLGVLALTVWPIAIVFCWIVFVVAVLIGFAGLVAIVILSHRLAKASGAKPKEPKFDGDRPTSVDWWGLIAAGFELRKWPDRMEIPEWKISGRPWRVLVRGDTYLPVFLRGSLDRNIYKQHFARIAAYSELLSRSTQGESPYDVVLYARSNDAVAIPATPSARRALADGVAGLRRLVALARGGLQPEAPDNKSPCRRCPYGELVPLETLSPRKPESDTDPVEIKGREFHSPCGVRFGWRPPHLSLRRVAN